jgi:hypothetical protein
MLSPKHYIFTRFSILDEKCKGFRMNLKDYLFSRDRLNFKFMVFDKMTYPSIINQTYTNYEWIIYTSNYLPNFYKTKLEKYKTNNIYILYVDSIKEMRNSTEDILKDKSNYTSMRLDDDDGLCPEFLENINKYSDKKNRVISFPNGIRYTIDNNSNIIFGSKMNKLKLALGLTAIEFNIFSAGHHRKVDEKYEVIYDNTSGSYFVCCSEFCDTKRKFY